MNRVGKDTQSNILEHWSVLKIPALMSAYLWKFLAETSFKMNAPFDPAVLLRENCGAFLVAKIGSWKVFSPTFSIDSL